MTAGKNIHHVFIKSTDNQQSEFYGLGYTASEYKIRHKFGLNQFIHITSSGMKVVLEINRHC